MDRVQIPRRKTREHFVTRETAVHSCEIIEKLQIILEFHSLRANFGKAISHLGNSE